MMSLTESFNPSKHTPLYENEENEREILQTSVAFSTKIELQIILRVN